MMKQSRIQSIEQLIDFKSKRLNYTRTPYLREYLLQDMEDLKQVEGLFSELQTELQKLNQDYENLALDVKKLEIILQIFGLSEIEVFAYRITDFNELKRLYIRAIALNEFQTPQRFATSSK